MSQMQAEKRAYVTPRMNLLVIRAEERFTASSGGCDIDVTKGGPSIVVNDLETDTLLAVSGMRVMSSESPYLLRYSLS